MQDFDQLADLDLENMEEVASAACPTCVARHPGPQVTGNLKVDPEIKLPSPGMDVAISYYYNSSDKAVGPYGYGRTISTNLTLTALQLGKSVAVVRGDGSRVRYSANEAGKYICAGKRARTKLVLNDARKEWIETTRDGIRTIYPVVAEGRPSQVSYVEDAVGNRHTYSYNSLGLLVALTDVVGRQVHFHYDRHNLLTEIVDWAGRKTAFTYDTDTNPKTPFLTKVTGPTGCQTLFNHHSDGLLTSITDANGYETTYEYDSDERVTRRVVAGIAETNYVYDSSDPGKSRYSRTTIDAHGNKWTRAFDSSSGHTQHMSPSGVTQVSKWNKASRSVTTYVNDRPVGSKTYDAKGNVVEETTASGSKTRYEYDQFNNLLAVTRPDGVVTRQIWGFKGSEFDETGVKRRLQVEIDALGNKTIHTYNKFGQRTLTRDIHGGVTKNEYDEYGNIVSKVLPTGASWSLKYDAAGNVVAASGPGGVLTQVEYDARNRRTKVTDALGNVTLTAYDGNGNKTVVVDPLGNRWEWKYNVWDNVEEATSPMGHVSKTEYDKLGRAVAHVNALGNRSRTEYDADGHVTANYDALGNRTVYEYDKDGRRTAVTNPHGGRTQTVFDDHGRNVGIIDAAGNCTTIVYDLYDRVVGRTDALGNRAMMAYDEWGRQITIMDALGNKSHTVYDKLGRVAAQIDGLGNRTQFVYDNFSRRIATIDPLGRQTTVAYDALGRVASTTDQTGAVTKYGYVARGQAIDVFDPLGNKTRIVYDALGRATATIDEVGATTSWTFDADGRQSTETNALGHITQFEHDAVGRRTVVTDANGNRTVHAYDAVGRITALTDTAGKTTKHEYDPSGNKIRTVTPDAESVEFKFDATGREIARNLSTGETYAFRHDATGKRIWESDARGETQYEYDAAGRLARVTLVGGRALEYKYDAAGHRTEMTGMDGGKTTYGFDAAGRTTFVTNPFGETTRFEYDDAGRRRLTRHSNGIVTTKQFNALSLETRRTETDAAGKLLASYESTYDARGNRIAAAELDGSVTRYGYDTTNQLVSEDRIGGPESWSIEYKYDPLGNRLTRTENGTVTRYEYGPANAILAEISHDGSVIEYGYDDCGRLVSETNGSHVTTRKWDAGGRLRAITLPDGRQEHHEYNADGIRVSKIAGAVNSQFIIDGKNVIAETIGDGTLLASWTHVNPEWGGLIAERRNGVTYTFGFDASFNTRLLTDGVGDVAAAFAYDAFGVERRKVTVPCDTPHQFGGEVGYWQDAPSRVYVRARWLDTGKGRWDSRDPVGFRGGDWNLYRYVGNNPSDAPDPNGLGCNDPCTDLVSDKTKEGCKDVLKCLAKAGGNKEKIHDCVKDAIKSGGQAAIAYLACEGASYLDHGTPDHNPCGCDDDTQLAENCCYETYLAAILNCPYESLSKRMVCVPNALAAYYSCMGSA